MEGSFGGHGDNEGEGEELIDGELSDRLDSPAQRVGNNHRRAAAVNDSL